MLRLLFAGLAAFAAILALAYAPKHRVKGIGGFVHAHDSLETISIQIDATQGVTKGWIVIAGDIHDEHGDHLHGGRPGPSRFPSTYIKSERISDVKVVGRKATITAIGYFNDAPSNITITVEDGGKKSEDHLTLEVKPFSAAHAEPLMVHGHMIIGDIAITRGGK